MDFVRIGTGSVHRHGIRVEIVVRVVAVGRLRCSSGGAHQFGRVIGASAVAHDCRLLLLLLLLSRPVEIAELIHLTADAVVEIIGRFVNEAGLILDGLLLRN